LSHDVERITVSANGIEIRVATVADAADIRRIYGSFVDNTAITFDDETPAVEEFEVKIAERLEFYPWLIAETDERQVAGYAYGARFHARPAYRWSAEVSVYIAREFHRRGVGRSLYQKLLPLLGRQNLRMVHAGITLPNAASVGLHESLGFQRVGFYPNVGYKLGKWQDVGWWALDLQAVPSSTEPIAFDPKWLGEPSKHDGA
jgi:phosphinothricin acetyltransferase